ncbi:MAG: HAMP domain-containing protein [Methylobacteriaceae bacterium]|nr:HAMP domain-containing protein [Methylobacteriaceae bacterium]
MTTIRGLVRGISGASALALAILALVAGYTLGQLRVGGPVYADIIASKDLVADILPPPLYVVEAMLEVSLLDDKRASLDEHRTKLASLRTDFNERRQYWRGSDLPENLKRGLEAAAVAAMPFWDAVETGILPALAAGNVAQAKVNSVRAQEAYAAHRAAVDKLVAEAKTYGDRVEAEAGQRTTLLSSILYAVSALGLMVAVAGAILLTRKLVAPLSALAQTLAQLAGGDTEANVPYTTGRNEIGAMARAVQVFKETQAERLALEGRSAAARAQADRERELNEASRLATAREQEQVVRSLAHGLEHLAAGKLDVRLTEPFPAASAKLREDFNAAMGTLQGAMDAVIGAARSVQAGTDEIRQATDDLSQRTERQAASLEQTAAALDEVTAAVRATADGAKEVRQMVATARNDAQSSGEVVQGAVGAMSDIKQSAQQITQIISVIDEIAFQTNLLALNAGVEAARAGEAGRGFAVVAQEVRALAQRSAEAAKDIKGLIQSSSDQVETGADRVERAGLALQRIMEHVAAIDARVEEIAASAREQATGLAEVNTAVNDMDQATQQNAAMVEETTAASEALARTADELARLVSRFEAEGAHPSARRIATALAA